MRLFISINFDDETRGRILAVQNRLRSVARGNFSREENLHLTLAFLGEVEPRRAPAVCRAMEEVPMSRLLLRFEKVGAFRRTGGDIWWIGLEKSPALLELQNNLAESLAAAGFLTEERGFVPHITMARQASVQEKPDRDAILGEPFSTEADAMCLMLSERVQGRLCYRELFCRKAGE